MKGSFRLLTHLFAFLATFSLEVTVHAVTQEPALCAQNKNVVCAFKAAESVYAMKTAGATVTLDHESSVIRLNDREYRLLSGSVMVRASAPVTIHSEFGEIVLSEGAEALISRTSSRIKAVALKEALQLKPRGPKAVRLEVGEGLENSIGQTGSDGQASTGIPVAVSFKDVVVQWARLFDGTKAEFEVAVADFRARWETAAVDAASIHEQLYTRKVAAAEEVQRARQHSRAKEAAESQALRDLYRRKVFEGF